MQRKPNGIGPTGASSSSLRALGHNASAMTLTCLVVMALLCGATLFARGSSATTAATSNTSGCGPALPTGAVVVTMASTPSGGGYWETDQFGDVAAFGDASCKGSLTGITLNQPVVAMASTPTGNGYWLVASDGGIFSFGDAAFYGSMANITLNQPVVAMASTPTGNGYWLVASDGGIFSFGDAAFYGSMANITLNQPVVAMASTPTGNGYWLVASDGGIFSFGDAAFYGSMANITLNQPVVAMASTPTGNGYWLVASDGGIFSFGDAAFYGSMANITLNQPVVAMASTPTGNGYWLVASDGGIFSFGDAAFYGRGTIPESAQSCTSAALSVSLGQATTAAGSRGQRLTITDIASSVCTLYGYPGMLMLNSSGSPLPTHVVRVGTAPEKAITLAPGEKASFLAYWPDATGYANEHCPTSSRVEITPPNTNRPLTIAWQITPYGGTPQNLRCGQITVSPVGA